MSNLWVTITTVFGAERDALLHPKDVQAPALLLDSIAKIWYAVVEILYSVYIISRSFNDRPNEILIIKVLKFNTSFTMLLWANWHVRTLNQKFIRLDIKRRREKQFSTSFKYHRF